MALLSVLETIPLSALAVALVLLFALYKHIVHPVFFSPLAGIPNAHWSAPLSRLWILNHRRCRRDTFAVHKAHQDYGPIVRLAPNEVSVNSVDGGLRVIYAGGFEKGDWYSNVFSNYGVKPMFAMEEHAAHSRRKRMVSNIYAKSTVQGSPSMQRIANILLDDRFIPVLKVLAASDQPIEFYTVFGAITTDFTSAYVFGLQNSTNYVQQPEMGVKFFGDFKARQQYQFWPQELPRFTGFLQYIGLLHWIVPSWVGPANQDLENWVIEMSDKSEATVRLDGSLQEDHPEDWPTVYAQLRSAFLKEAETKEGRDVSVEKVVADHRLAIASELLDHTLAGFDTSSITLTFLAWELSLLHNAQWQERLHEELKGLQPGWDAKEIDALPVLHAALMETLRLHAAIPGNQPRITPAGASLGPPEHTIKGVPANVRVQAQAWSLHRNAEVFPDPETWNPGRWLDSSAAELKEMQRWFWAFGSGGRMCVGSNLAMVNMKAIIAAIWGTFKTSVAADDGMVHNGGYVAEPIGKNGHCLLLTLESR